MMQAGSRRGAGKGRTPSVGGLQGVAPPAHLTVPLVDRQATPRAQAMVEFDVHKRPDIGDNAPRPSVVR